MRPIAPPDGKLAVLMPGLGAVATTFVAGVEAVRRGMALPIGSLTQMGHIRLGKRTEKRQPLIREFVPLVPLADLEFGGWDIYRDDCYTAAVHARVLERSLLDPMKDALSAIRPMSAVFDPTYIRRISGENVKRGPTKRHLAEALVEDILEFQKEHGCARAVVVWCASTETYQALAPCHERLSSFEAALDENDPRIAPSMIYAYSALKAGAPFAMGAPNVSVDIPALVELSQREGVPLCGRDFKTGQTLIKTVIAPMLKARMLGLSGWFSTNILGNRDGEVLDDPGSFRTKEVSKLSVLDTILQPEQYPELYGHFDHQVRINYYPPRGDNKEGWDNIDIFGWLGYPMQIKVNFLCRDSILAAPIVLDVALFMDLARRVGMFGIQEWMSFYFKSPLHDPAVLPEHDLFIQLTKLKNTLRHLRGEAPITHLEQEYSAA